VDSTFQQQHSGQQKADVHKMSFDAPCMLSCRLLRTGKSASSAASDGDRDSAAEQDVDVLEHFSDATSSGEQLQAPHEQGCL
jgi:hypothetical protein